MLLVVAAMFAILAMAALAIDVMTLYAAHTDAQRASDAAALAGARMYVLSGFTSWQLGDPSLVATQSPICSSGAPGSGVANSEAVTVAAQNQIAGQTAAVTSINCNFTTPENPRLTVTTGRTNLPTFFGRIFGQRTVSVSASSTAEVFNASGSSVPISVASVKPWLLPNCNPNSPPCGGGDFFIDTANSYALKNPTAFIGQTYSLQMRRTPSPQNDQYYALDMSAMQATVCPSSSARGCLNVGGGGYLDNIACANTNRLSCGSVVTLSNRNRTGWMRADNLSGAQCLIHTDNIGPSADQDQFFSSGAGNPVVITGGLANPNPALQGVPNISRSDSAVTVPVFEWNGVDPCAGGTCGGTETVIGFLQLAVLDAGFPITSSIDVMVLNAAGCNPSNSGTPVTGGGVSAVPVRLVQ